MGRRVPKLGGLGGGVIAGRSLLGLLLLAVVAAAVIRSPSAPSVEETTYRLQAESLFFDFDLVYDEADIERFRAHGWDRDSLVALGLRASELDTFQRPFPYALLLAPFVALAPERGPALLNSLLLVLAAALALRLLERRVGDVAPWVTAALVFGSTVFASVFLALPDVLLVAATVAGLALAEGPPVAAGALPDMYPGGDSGEDSGGGSRGDAPRASVLRWLGVGLLLGVVCIHHPVYLVLAVLIGLRLPRAERASALPLIVLGLVMVLLVGWWAGGLYADLGPAEKLARAADSVEEMRARGASPFTGAAKRVTWPPRLEPALLGWNALYLALGRHCGLLPYTLPLVLVLFLAAGTGRLRQTLPLVLLAVTVFVFFFPFNIFGGPAIGNRWFLPLYAALWTAPARPSSPAGPFLVLLIGGVLLLPLWTGGSPAEHGPGAALFERLPFETTQREAPVSAEVVLSELRVRATSSSVTPGAGERPLALEGGRRAELMVVSGSRLESLLLDFGPAAKGEPVLGGGQLGRTIFRPDGGVSYEVVLDGRERRHSTWWSREVHSTRMLRFEMPKSGDLDFAVSAP